MSITLLEIGLIQEFGAPRAHIPERSFLRAYVDGHETEIRQRTSGMVQAALRGKMDPNHILPQLGAKSVGEIQERIASNIPPPLNPETVDRKGSSVALIDTGQLRASITYRVRSVA